VSAFANVGLSHTSAKSSGFVAIAVDAGRRFPHRDQALPGPKNRNEAAEASYEEGERRIYPEIGNERKPGADPSNCNTICRKPFAAKISRKSQLSLPAPAIYPAKLFFLLDIPACNWYFSLFPAFSWGRRRISRLEAHITPYVADSFEHSGLPADLLQTVDVTVASADITVIFALTPARTAPCNLAVASL
jgi:hypothetical protein